MQLRPFRRYMMIKRLSDILMASVGLVLLSPLMVVIAIMIKLNHRVLRSLFNAVWKVVRNLKCINSVHGSG